jgi:hypothetical protein
MFSRNAASSRAVPSSKLIKAIEEDPFVPLAFQRSHSGMQGTEYITDLKEIEFEVADWLDDRDYAIKKAKKRLERGITKQLINRPLETFQYYTTLVTATEWENFFALRCPQYQGDDGMFYRSKRECESYSKLYAGYGAENLKFDWLERNKGQAEIHMMALAEAMWDNYNESTPKLLQAGEWHIPFGDQIDHGQLFELLADYKHGENESVGDSSNKFKIKIATARCARISYTVVGEEDKKDNYENDIKLHDRLMKSGHMSPFEHCAKAMDINEADSFNGYAQALINATNTKWSGNFRGFIQYRKTILNENITA